MRDCPNVHIETSNLVGQGYIESVVREFGAQRLLYGSFLPVNDPFAAAGMLVDADIAESDKLLIASGNIRRLMGDVKI
jgi:predicted TIM-barrel fold metal-dependent hydrolase